MTLAADASFYQWIMTTPMAKFMISAEWVFPTVQSLHFIGFALSIGTIAIVDLRLLGWGVRGRTAGELAADLNLWTNIGIALMLTTGPLMFSTDAVTYHYNPSFQFKMICLMAALVFHFTLHRLVLRPRAPLVAGKLAAVFSLLLWSSVLAGGRFIAFV